MHHKIPEDIIIFIGDGPEEKNLKQQVSKLNLNSGLNFLMELIQIRK